MGVIKLCNDVKIQAKGSIEFCFGELRCCSSEHFGDLGDDSGLLDWGTASLSVSFDEGETFLSHLQCRLR